MPTHRIRTLPPTGGERGHLILRDPTTQAVILRIPWNQPPVATAPPEEPAGILEGSIKRGSLNLASDFTNTGGLIAELLGADEFALGFYDKATEFSTRADQYRPSVGKIENVGGPRDLGVWLVETLVEQAPMIASMLVPGGIVGRAARFAGATKGGATVAATTAAFLSNVGFQTGESVSIAREADKSPADVRVIGSGLGKAALDFVPLIAVAKRLGLLKNLPIAQTVERALVGHYAEGGFIRRAAGNARAIVVREIPTELAQEGLNIALQRTLQEYSGDLTDEEKSQLVNAAAGAAAFGLLGIPAAVRRVSPNDIDPTDDTTPPGVDIQIDDTVETLNVDITQGTEPVNFQLVGDVFIEPDVAAEPTVGELTDTVPILDAKLPKLEDEAVPLDAKAAALAALAPEVARTDSSFYIDLNGDMNTAIFDDPMRRSEGGTDPISVGLELTREQLEVVSSYPEYLDSDPSSPEAQVLAALHPGLQLLFERRLDVINDSESYRSTDGQLKAAAKKKLEGIDKRIKRLQENLGLKPTETEVKDATEENVQQGEVIVETPPTALTDRQKERLEKLDAKQQEPDGLTEAEYETYAELIGIAAGQFGPVERQRQTQAQLTETSELASEVRGEETTRVGELFSTVRRVKGTPGKGITTALAQGLLARFAKRFRFGPRVRILTNDHPHVKLRQKRHGVVILGWWDPKKPGEINIVSDNIHSEKDLYATYLHETLAHYGMNTFLTVDEQFQILDEIVKNPPPGFDIEKIRRDYRDRGQTAKLWVEAEEYIARVAETITLDPNNSIAQMSWWKRLMSFIKRFLNKSTPFKWNDNDIVYMLRDTSKLLTGQLTPRNLLGYRLGIGKIRQEIGLLNAEVAEARDEESRTLAQERLKTKAAELRQAGIYPESSEMFSVLGGDIAGIANESVDSLTTVWGARFAKMMFTPLQFASKYKVPGSAEYLEVVQEWWARKRLLTDNSAQLALQFMQYGRRDQIKLAEVMLAIPIRSDELGRRLTQAELREEFKKAGMSEDTALIKQWEAMDDSFIDVVKDLRKALETNAIRTQGDRKNKKLDRATAKTLQKQYADAQAGTAEDRTNMWQALGVGTMLRLAEIDEEMNQLQNRNYFPRMRFGNWAITIRAKKDLIFEGKTYRGPTKSKKGDTVYFETFESLSAQKDGFAQLAKEFGQTSFQMQKGKIAENEFHFMGVMSPQLYEQLVGDIPGMNEEQKEVLKEIYLRQAPGRSFLRHLTRRKGVAGYSEDVLRVYSSYMMNVANHIARLEFHIDMNDQLTVIKENAANVVPDANTAGVVREFFGDHFDYIMNPKNDLARLRAMGFLWYLGANVKSAVVNLTQVPMVAYPFLASKHGDARASKAILSALKMVTQSKMGGKVLPPEIRRQLEIAVREGFVEESRATELAGLAEQSTLQRIIPENKTGRAIANASFYGAWLFQKAERFNREVTFIAGYTLAKENGVTSQDEAFKAGRKAVQTAMFEYAKWNRAAFMRGKKSVFFLFWQYMQGMAFMAFGGAGQGAAMRLWMMLLLAGGIQGLPFAENILDLLDFVGTKTKERLGMKDPRVDLRNDIRELATEITDRPDLIMHGLSRYYGLGPLHLLNMFDVPVPNVDISGSISVGRILPGTEAFSSSERDPSAKLGRFVADIAGPVAGIPYQFYRAMLDTNPDTWKVWERTLPSAMKNVSAALRRGHEGKEVFRGGGTIATFDWGDTEHRGELIAQSLGFATTRLNQRYEVDFSIENMKRYWAIRRGLVMENVAYARMAGDPEVVKDAFVAMRKFNEEVPDPALRIRGDRLQASLKQRFRRASLRERGIPSELLFRRIARSMRELYPETEVEIESSSRQ